MMPERDVRTSYEINRFWAAFWRYTFGLKDYTPKQIEITAATYDATVAELDDLFKGLITTLDAAGHLRNTIVVLTSDHGEQLGEHHMFDHQYSLYEPLLRVPLIVRYPGKIPAGRESRPVVNYDLFPTLLRLAGVEMPESLKTHAVDLLTPDENRIRLAECLGIFEGPFEMVQRIHPSWDSTPWTRELRAWMEGGHKYIWASDGRHSLYDIANDPGEEENLVAEAPSLAGEMDEDLQAFLATLSIAEPKEKAPPQMSDEHRDLLRSLGYIDSYGSADSGGGR